MGAGQNFTKGSPAKPDLAVRGAARRGLSLLRAYKSTPVNTLHEAARCGFSLVELMITIAVLGVLASISVPTYISYSKRAMQAEAKSVLMGIFAAEKNFYSEWGVYVGTLPIAGYEPAGDYSYMAGFSARFIKGGVSCDDAATNIKPIVNPSTGVGQHLPCGPRLVKFTGSIPADIGGGQDSLDCTSTWRCENVFAPSNHKCKSKKCKWVGPQLAFGGNLNAFELKAEPYDDYDPTDNSTYRHTFVGVDQFKAVALSCLQSSCSSLGAADVWSVNHKKNMVHVKDGLQ